MATYQAGPLSPLDAAGPIDSAAQLAGLAAEQLTSAVNLLQRVEKVEIRQRIERRGHGRYVLEVFLVPSSRERRRRDAIKDPFQRASAPRDSDYQVDHGYADFISLCGFIRSLVAPEDGEDAASIRARHTGECYYCARLESYLTRERWSPSAGLRIVATKSVKMRSLTTFINRMLQLAVSDEALAGVSLSCRACVHIPLLLEHFLHKPREESLGLI